MNSELHPFGDLLLRFFAIVAAFSVALLRNELDSRTVIVVVVTVLYVGAYLVAVFPRFGWEALQIGFTAGFSISICPALFLVLAMKAISFPTAYSSSPPVWRWAYHFAWVANLILFAIAIGCWVSSTPNQRIANRSVTRYFLFGLAYPYLAFVLVGIASVLFAR